MFRKISVSVLSLAAIFLSLPASMLACACCAEPGLYSIRTGKPSTYELGLMKDIEFNNVAKLYLPHRLPLELVIVFPHIPSIRYILA